MTTALPRDLQSALGAFAVRDTILIALDFDGTLAPLVDDPEASRMITPARLALEELTEMAGVTIALVTGRAIDSIMRVSEPLEAWYLVGSHGIEVVSPGELRNYETPWVVPEALTSAFVTVVDAHPGSRLEQKPFGLALHTRGVDPVIAAAAEAAAHEVCASWGGDLAVRTGHGIVECSIHHATKADGLKEIQKRATPDATLFAGDDTTDEDGFGVLRPSDVAIRVGGGETIAPYGLADASAVAEALWFIHSRRSSATAGS